MLQGRAEDKLSRRQRRLRYAARRVWGLAVGLVIVGGVIVADRLGLFGVRPATPQGDIKRYHGKSFRVVNVVDGDTIDVGVPDKRRGTTRVRLWGVDTPETKHPHKPVQHFGPEAEAYTRFVCTEATVKLQLVPGRDTRDRHGRLLAYVILPDGHMLNRELVRLGYGYADPRFDHPHKDEFAKLQAEAIAARRGLWKDIAITDLPYYFADKLPVPERR